MYSQNFNNTFLKIFANYIQSLFLTPQRYKKQKSLS